MLSIYLRGSGSRDAKHLPARFRLAFSSSTIDLRSSSAISARMFTTARADGVHFEVQDFRHNVNGSEHGFARGIFSQPRHWQRGRAINAMLARMQHATAQATGCPHGRWSGQLPVLGLKLRLRIPAWMAIREDCFEDLLSRVANPLLGGA